MNTLFAHVLSIIMQYSNIEGFKSFTQIVVYCVRCQSNQKKPNKNVLSVIWMNLNLAFVHKGNENLIKEFLVGDWNRE
jgi:hypothetical protein